MNIIKETLEKTFEELNKQIHHQETLRCTHLVDKANQTVYNIDDLFKEYLISVSETNIRFKYTTDTWYDFSIERKTNYTKDGYEYSKATLSTSSVSNADESGLKKLLCLGVLAKHCLNKTNEWNELVSLMDESNEIYKTNISPLYTQIYQIEEQLRKIRNEEQSNEFQNIFNKGTFKLNKKIDFHYGSGKWDRVYSNEWFWEANESGKTYTLSYNDKVRTNPHYDSEGNSLEGIFEVRKRSIDKRIKKVDIESFVRYNMNLILVEVAS
jgi:hypothetical protein